MFRRSSPRRSAPALAALMLFTVCAAARAEPAQTVVITATRYAKPVVDAPAALSVITRRDIEARGATNLLEALRGETGITLQGRTIGGRKSFSLRGTDGKHTLLMIDGKRVTASEGVIGHSDYQFDWIAVQDIERIEIVRGPMSVLYGAEALGGVINIITRRTGQTWSGDASVQAGLADGAGGGDSERIAVRGSGPVGPGLSLSLSAAHGHLQALRLPEDLAQTEIEGRRNTDASIGLEWQPGAAHRVEFEWRAGDELRDGVSRETRGARRYYDNLTTLTRRQASLGWTADWAGAAKLQTQLRAYGTRLTMENQRSNGVTALRPEQLDDQIVEGQASFDIGADQMWVTGMELRRETLRITGITGGQGSVDHAALFAQNELRLTRDLSLTAGLRLDHHEIYGREWSPRLYLVWHPASTWTVKGGYAHGFKAPSLKQISPDAAEDQGPFTYFGNPDLRPETNDSIEIGIGRDTERMSWQVMAFNNRVRDLIVHDRSLGVVNGKPSFIYDNRDRATLRGAELSARWEATSGVGLGINYQYLDATDSNGQRLEKRPRHSLGLRTDWRHDRWRLGADLTFAADQWLKGSSGTALVPVSSITRLGLWSVYDLGGGLQLNAGIDNVGNQRLADSSALFTYAEPPRTLRVTLRGRF